MSETRRPPASGRPLVLLGCGYTLSRVARMARAGERAEKRAVLATTRDPARLRDLATRGVAVHALDLEDPASLHALAEAVPSGSAAALSIPPLRGPDGPRDATPRLMEVLAPRLSRLVYLSSTGVYGNAAFVDATTPPAPVTPGQHARLAAEDACRAAVASTLVLRPAAIAGPGRGVHVRLRAGTWRIPGDGTNYVSRIHVDDLAALVLAALDADLVGAWPAADREPARSGDVARTAAERLGLPPPEHAPLEAVHETLRFSRRVDARATFEALGVTLRYPTYRESLEASLEEESR